MYVGYMFMYYLNCIHVLMQKTEKAPNFQHLYKFSFDTRIYERHVKLLPDSCSWEGYNEYVLGKAIMNIFLERL